MLSEWTGKHLTWQVSKYTKRINVEIYSRDRRWYFGVLILISNISFFHCFINAYKLNLNSAESNLGSQTQVRVGREGLRGDSPFSQSQALGSMTQEFDLQHEAFYKLEIVQLPSGSDASHSTSLPSSLLSFSSPFRCILSSILRSLGLKPECLQKSKFLSRINYAFLSIPK